MSRKMIAALQISLDGFTQGEDTGEASWVDSWADALAVVPDVDTFVQGGGMYPGYAEYWSSIQADPHRAAPLGTRVPYEREIAYASFAARTPHFILSTTLPSVSWPPTAEIVRDIGALRHLKGRMGKNIYVVGGATIVGSLLNENLLDELRLIVHPLLLGGGKTLWRGLKARRVLTLVDSKATAAGRLIVTYRT